MTLNVFLTNWAVQCSHLPSTDKDKFSKQKPHSSSVFVKLGGNLINIQRLSVSTAKNIHVKNYTSNAVGRSE